jgi:hypothetical protein
MELEPEDPFEGLGTDKSERWFAIILFVVLCIAAALFVIPWYVN